MRAKKYVVIYAVAVFLIIFLITFNSVCAITQFDVKYNVGSAQMTQAAQRVQSTLEDRYLNKSYLFFKDFRHPQRRRRRRGRLSGNYGYLPNLPQ